MKRLFHFYFGYWGIPILVWAISLFLILTSAVTEGHSLDKIAWNFFYVAFISLFISVVYQLVKKKWVGGVLSAICVFGTGCVLLLYGFMAILIETIDGDRWADHLIIPAGIQLDTPVDQSKRTSFFSNSVAEEHQHSYFQLYNSYQPGLYEYDFWTNEIDHGTIYIKAFEITQKYPLSQDALPERSAVPVYNSSTQLMKFSTTSNFTIYEGDWGKPYAARFELWFKPDNGEPECMLLSKNYKIEGWMR